MSYNDFVKETKKVFSKYSYSKEEVEKYFNTKDVQEILRENYEGYTERGIAGYSPAATASCLDMLH